MEAFQNILMNKQKRLWRHASWFGNQPWRSYIT